MKSREQVNAALAKLVSDGKISSEQAQLVAEELDPTSQGKSLSRVAEIGSYAGATLVAGAGLWMGIELTEGNEVLRTAMLFLIGVALWGAAFLFFNILKPNQNGSSVLFGDTRLRLASTLSVLGSALLVGAAASTFSNNDSNEYGSLIALQAVVLFAIAAKFFATVLPESALFVSVQILGVSLWESFGNPLRADFPWVIALIMVIVSLSWLKFANLFSAKDLIVAASIGMATIWGLISPSSNDHRAVGLALLAAVVAVAMFGQFKIGGWAFTAGAVGSLLALTFQVVAPVTQRALGLFITGLVMLLASWLLIRRDKRKSLKTLDSAN
ncbi:MAG: hypothetical protein GM45_0120 [actinobacterium acAMD-5]|jgi:hypothetical protein|nr:MAG: hypothetical protein GM45_0120 [actinobacterium acAMD-5]